MHTTVWQVALTGESRPVTGLGTSGFTRQVIAETLGVNSTELVLGRDARGRPVIESAHDVEFSVSHSGRFALIAVSGGTSVGVDAERFRDLADLEAMLAALVDDAERTAILRLSPEERRRRFFSLWTRREALAKAQGLGVDQLAGVEHRMRREHWTIVELPMPADYAATLAIAAPNASYSIRQCRWDDDNFPTYA